MVLLGAVSSNSGSGGGDSRANEDLKPDVNDDDTSPMRPVTSVIEFVSQVDILYYYEQMKFTSVDSFSVSSIWLSCGKGILLWNENADITETTNEIVFRQRVTWPLRFLLKFTHFLSPINNGEINVWRDFMSPEEK